MLLSPAVMLNKIFCLINIKISSILFITVYSIMIEKFENVNIISERRE